MNIIISPDLASDPAGFTCSGLVICGAREGRGRVHTSGSENENTHPRQQDFVMETCLGSLCTLLADVRHKRTTCIFRGEVSRPWLLGNTLTSC